QRSLVAVAPWSPFAMKLLAEMVCFEKDATMRELVQGNTVSAAHQVATVDEVECSSCTSGDEGEGSEDNCDDYDSRGCLRANGSDGLLQLRRVKAFIKDQNLGTMPDKRQTQRAAKSCRDARDVDEADEAASSHDNTDEDEEMAEKDEPDEAVVPEKQPARRRPRRIVTD
ncbi:MAG: hypothetical protein SGPRY_003906, partial [Prymnesium sp.]